MNRDEALAQMVAPGQTRKVDWRQGVLQILVTRTCDLACFACTQSSNLDGKAMIMTPDQFRTACRSLMEGPRRYFGVVGMFGGNPCMHPQFEELCSIMRQEIPPIEENGHLTNVRGLWSNNLRGHGATCRTTFNPGYSNLNVHRQQAAYEEMRRDWPECHPVGQIKPSMHAPWSESMLDVGVPEAERWDKIARCDINQTWSAMIGVVRGELRGFFCELAGNMLMRHQDEKDEAGNYIWEDTGVPITPGWWDQPMSAFAHQVDQCCHHCGIPNRPEAIDDLYGEAERASATHAGVYRPKRKGRPVELVQIASPMMDHRATFYIDKSKK